MKKRLFPLLLALLLLVPSLIIPASADTGPKPHVTIYFENPPEKTYYVTLLSQTESTGPHSVATARDIQDHKQDADYDIYMKFVNYQDADGFYFLQFYGFCGETDTFAWNYYPPYTFKVLVYFPESDTFAVSQICERKVFDSHFTADLGVMTAAADGSTTPAFSVRSSDSIFNQLPNFLARVVLTLVVELLIALPFGYWKKGCWHIIILFNLITQVLLNMVLSLYIYYRGGGFALIPVYFLAELAVLVIEGWGYSLLLPDNSRHPKARAWGYAFLANTCSFIFGMFLWVKLSAIF